jgi:hypothetical protein
MLKAAAPMLSRSTSTGRGPGRRIAARLTSSIAAGAASNKREALSSVMALLRVNCRFAGNASQYAAKPKMTFIFRYHIFLVIFWGVD